MSLILHIDTAVQVASVCLSKDRSVIATGVNPSEKESASWLHVAIQSVLQENNFTPAQLDAVAVSTGPGSYTGLRVGLSAAKGLCYALSIPLISINTLQMMAAGVKNAGTSLLCPMIDARRMEVFTALYNSSVQEVAPATNMILDETSFAGWLQENTISFFGNGSRKAEGIIKHFNASFVDHTATAADMVLLATEKFEKGDFSDLAYSEPYYGKDFHSPISKKIY
ncbi:MAG TPA: tRNA (adenosine(37)-N6)-threonylcarbamoyltransferase complex dimerization subunit type 1 TsaB [Flavisolibacter sp.]|nr:tRNA (adenosine(37)-N6)-threonylcarbamoyltransferase complex dimerization subunit type 1 TsaB [Flavisolibacter sp.]